MKNDLTLFVMIFMFNILYIQGSNDFLKSEDVNVDKTVQTYFVKLQWMYFKTQDSVYPITKYYRPKAAKNLHELTGFFMGHSDTTIKSSDVVRYVFTDRSGQAEAFKDTFIYTTNNIDTIKSFNPQDYTVYSDTSVLINWFSINEFRRVVQLSYIYHILGINRLDHSQGDLNVRFIDLYTHDLIYILELNLFEDSGQVRLVIVGNGVHSGLKFKEDKTLNLSERQLRRIKNRYKELLNAAQKECKGPDLRVLFETYNNGKYSNSISSDYCLRGNRKEFRDLRRSIRFIYRLTR